MLARREEFAEVVHGRLGGGGVSECMGSAGDVYTTAESSTASSVFAFDSATTPSENVVLLEGAVEPCRAVGRKRRE